MEIIKKYFVNRVIKKCISSDNRKKNIHLTYHFDRESLKKRSVILLSDHSAMKNFSNILADFFFVSDNIIPVIGDVMDYAPGVGLFLKHYEHISKKMFVTDFSAIMKMNRTIKNGKGLLLFPEGTHSFCGLTHPVSPVLGGLLKKLNTDVILASTKGAYLSTPIYSKDTKKGPIEVEFFHLFTKTELKEKSEAEIYDKFMNYFAYNDFSWNAENNYSYIGEEVNAKGIEKILYKCPSCHEEGCITTENDLIVCEHCGNTVRMDDTYAIYPSTNDDILPFKRVDEWYLSQRQALAEEIINDAGFCLELKCELNLLNKDDNKSLFKAVGSGVIKISREGVLYTGTEKGEKITFTLPIKGISGTSLQYEKYMVMYRGNETIAFDCSTEKPGIIVKACGAIEELHALVDPLWAEACRRAYPIV